MRFIKILFKGLLGVLLLLVIVYLLGPRAERPELRWDFPSVETDLRVLEQSVHAKEAAIGNIKAGNESKIVWADKPCEKTQYSVVYLHGFGASHGEGNPIHIDFAERFGCNLYLARLQAHGLKSNEAFLELSADKWVDSALEAVAIAKQLGEKVIIIGGSTGATLALAISAKHPEIFANICYSPNIAIYDPKATLLTKPWGLKIAKAVTGGDYRSYEETEEYQKWWYCKYRIEGVLPMMVLIEETMKPEVFAKVRQPLFMGYYYKDEIDHDQVVSVPAMLEMFDQLGTPDDLKKSHAFPNAGNHVFTSNWKHGDLNAVRLQTFRFAEKVLKMEAVGEGIAE